MKKIKMYGWDREEYQKNKDGNYIIPVSEIGKSIKFHDIVEDNPKYYGTPEYEALKHSIEVDGYDEDEPLYVWRGKIVDGWHRSTASIELGLETIIAKELPYRSTLADIKSKAIRTEIGRQMTKTQLAIKAWKQKQQGTYKNVEQAALSIGTTATSIKAVSYVAKHGDADWIDRLFVGELIKYDYSKPSTDSIFTIKAFLEKKKKIDAENRARDANRKYKKMTDEEMKMIRSQLDVVLAGKCPEDIKSLGAYLYMLSEEATKKEK